MLFEVADCIGPISRILEGLQETMQTETMINIMASEAIKTFEIEVEYLNCKDVMFSIKRNLVLNPESPLTKDKKALGI